jgi:hypothetical protein
MDIEDGASISDWHERFELYVLTNTAVTKANKTAYYVTMAGRSAYRLLKDLAYPQSVPDLDVETLKQLLVDHLQPANFEAVEREKFHNLQRRHDETFRSFILRVQQAAARCNFDTNLEDQMRDRLVAGIQHADVKRKLLQESSLSYKTAKTILETWNDVSATLNESQHQTNEVFRNKRVSARPHHKPRQLQHETPNLERGRASISRSASSKPTGRCQSCVNTCVHPARLDKPSAMLVIRRVT